MFLSCKSLMLSHSFLCLCRCFFLHDALQYFTILHLLHLLFTSSPSLPQLAHTDIDILLSSVLMYCNFPITSHTSSLSLQLSVQILSDVLIILILIYRQSPYYCNYYLTCSSLYIPVLFPNR